MFIKLDELVVSSNAGIIECLGFDARPFAMILDYILFRVSLPMNSNEWDLHNKFEFF